jgi:hypothetical protein
MGHRVRRHIEDSRLIAQYIGKEVFLVVGSEDEEASDIGVFETWGDLVEHLKTLTPTSDPETRVFHGMLTIGEFLPISFRGKSAYVICLDPCENSKGCVVESSSSGPEGLAEEISSVMRLGGQISDTKIDIDDIYILYGYQLEICLSINDDDIDEEVISTCKEIANEIEIARILVENG